MKKTYFFYKDKRFMYLILLLITFNSYSQTLTSISSTNADGRYDTGETINFVAEFDEWLAPGSTVTVQLNNGENVTLTFSGNRDDYLDQTWGDLSQDNTNDTPESANGINVFDEFTFGSFATADEGKPYIFIGGGTFTQYEGITTSRFVITDNDGIPVVTFVNGGGTDGSDGTLESFNGRVYDAINTPDGGLIIGGGISKLCRKC